MTASRILSLTSFVQVRLRVFRKCDMRCCPARLSRQCEDFAGALPHGTVAFADGESRVRVSIGVVADSVAEASEEFLVRIATGEIGNSLALVAVPTATATIDNDDGEILGRLLWATPNISATEGNHGQVDVAITLLRTQSTAAEATARYHVEGAVVNASDFIGGVLPEGEIKFLPGEDRKTIHLLVSGDQLAEHDETFTVKLTDVVNAVADATNVSGVIANDDSRAAVYGVEGALVSDSLQIGPRDGITREITIDWGDGTSNLAIRN